MSRLFKGSYGCLLHKAPKRCGKLVKCQSNLDSWFYTKPFVEESLIKIYAGTILEVSLPVLDLFYFRL
jgi:hypothetical protein